MKKMAWGTALALLVSAGSWWGLRHGSAGWQGTDETVVEKFARAAGHPARKPYINTDRGDLLLFVFLLAGAAGGFVGGYCFLKLFASKDRITADG